jgi:hypothetical protein
MRAVHVTILLALTAGCSGADATPMVRVQAARDFVCAESTVEVRRELNGTYSAVGCGKHGNYRAVCEGTRCAVSKEGGNLSDPPSRAGAPDPVSNEFSR